MAQGSSEEFHVQLLDFEFCQSPFIFGVLGCDDTEKNGPGGKKRVRDSPAVAQTVAWFSYTFLDNLMTKRTFAFLMIGSLFGRGERSRCGPVWGLKLANP